jgi:hypothetical protein
MEVGHGCGQKSAVRSRTEYRPKELEPSRCASWRSLAAALVRKDSASRV